MTAAGIENHLAQKMVKKYKATKLDKIIYIYIYIFFFQSTYPESSRLQNDSKTKSTTIYILIKINYLGKPKHKACALPLTEN